MTKEKLSRVLLINDTTNWYHFGCTATSLAIKDEITKLGYQLDSISITETYKITAPPSSIQEFNDGDNFTKFFVSHPEIIKRIKENDIIIVNGEGTLHGVRPAPLSLLYLCYVAKVFCRKHVEIINHSIYPQDNLSIDDRNIINLYKLVYDAIDFAAIREPLSYNLARKIGIKAIESFDCSPIYIKNHYTPDRKKDPKSLLIAGSANWLHLNILSDEKGNLDEFKNGLSQFGSYLNAMHRQGYSITFLCGAKDWPAKDDREFIAFVKPRLKFDLKIFEAKNIDQWLSRIENAELLVSGRFHHTIAAGCLGTRFIALNSNTPKMDGLLEALGTERALRYDDPDLAEKLHKQTLESYDKSIDHILGQKLCDKAMLNFHCLHNAICYK